MGSEQQGFFEATEMPSAGWWTVLWPDPAAVLNEVGLRSGMEAIDLCSGDGWFTLSMAKTARHVVAIDIDGDLLEIGRRRLHQSGITNCDFVQGDAYEIGKLVPRGADFVLLANVFHGVPDRLRLAGAVRDALRPNGHFAIINWHRRPREETTILDEPRGPRSQLRMSPEQTIEAVEGSGLRFDRIVELPPYHYGALFTRMKKAVV